MTDPTAAAREKAREIAHKHTTTCWAEISQELGHSAQCLALRQDIRAALLRASAPPADADIAGLTVTLRGLADHHEKYRDVPQWSAEIVARVRKAADALAALAGGRDRLLSVMRRVQDCWNNYHGDLGSQKPGAEQHAREVQWPALLVAMEDFEEVLCNVENARAALGGSDQTSDAPRSSSTDAPSAGS